MPLGVGTVAPKALLGIPLGAHGNFSWFQACYACHITHPPRSFQAVWGNALPVVCRKGYFVERSRGRSPHWVFSAWRNAQGLQAWDAREAIWASPAVAAAAWSGHQEKFLRR